MFLSCPYETILRSTLGLRPLKILIIIHALNQVQIFGSTSDLSLVVWPDVEKAVAPSEIVFK